MQDFWVIDFEASSLSRRSHPIEVGVTNGKQAYSSLIQPMEHWSDWNQESEKIHNISRSMLYSHGSSASVVASDLNSLLSGKTIFCDCAEWDRFWKNVLFSDNSIHCLFDIEDIQQLLASRNIDIGEYLAMREVLVSSREYVEHRALDDARLIWKTINELLLLKSGKEILQARSEARKLWLIDSYRPLPAKDFCGLMPSYFKGKENHVALLDVRFCNMALACIVSCARPRVIRAFNRAVGPYSPTQQLRRELHFANNN